MNLPFRVISVASFICNLSTQNRNKSLFWWQCTWLLQKFKNLLCLFLHYPGRRCKHAFFPWLHAVFIIPDEYFHKCKPLGKTGLKQNVKASSFWFFSPSMGEIWMPWPRFLISLRDGSIKLFILRSTNLNYHLLCICILGPTIGHYLSCFI